MSDITDATDKHRLTDIRVDTNGYVDMTATEFTAREEAAYERGRAEVAAAVEAVLDPERGMGVCPFGDGQRFISESTARAALADTSGALDARLAEAYDHGWNDSADYMADGYDGPEDPPNPYRADAIARHDAGGED